MALRFLISRLSALGDVVHTLPAACALRQSFADCQITWAVDPRFAGIVECCAAVDRIELLHPGINPRSWRLKEAQRFDYAFDLQGLLKSGLVVWAARARHKLGYHWQREGSWLFSRAVPPAPTSKHVVEQYLDVVRVIGARAEPPEFGLEPKPQDLESVRAKLDACGAGGRPLAVLNAGAGWESKRWPPKSFATLCVELDRRGFDCVFIGTRSTHDLEAFSSVEAIAGKAARSMLGQTSPRELVALISLAAVHVGGDTGSTHIAAALSRPLVAMYSATDPARSGPYGHDRNVIYNRTSMANIEPEEALERVLAVIG